MKENFASLNRAVHRDLSEKLQIANFFSRLKFCILLSLSTCYSFFIFFVFVQVGFTANGKIKALDVTLYSNTGNSLDLSGPVSHISCVEAKAFFERRSLPEVRSFSRR